MDIIKQYIDSLVKPEFGIYITVWRTSMNDLYKIVVSDTVVTYATFYVHTKEDPEYWKRKIRDAYIYSIAIMFEDDQIISDRFSEFGGLED